MRQLKEGSRQKGQSVVLLASAVEQDKRSHGKADRLKCHRADGIESSLLRFLELFQL